jgi:hypothetical protein
MKTFFLFFIIVSSITQLRAQKRVASKSGSGQGVLDKTSSSASLTRGQENPDTEKLKILQRLKEKGLDEKAARLASAPSTVNADHLNKIQSSLKEDEGGNLIKPVIIIPDNLSEAGQTDAFFSLKKIMEDENTISTFIKTGDGEVVAFVIATREAFEKWMSSNPESLLAYVLQGTEDLQNASRAPLARIRDKYGIHKLVDMQLRKRIPASMVPSKVKVSEEVIESPNQ